MTTHDLDIVEIDGDLAGYFPGAMVSAVSEDAAGTMNVLPPPAPDLIPPADELDEAIGALALALHPRLNL